MPDALQIAISQLLAGQMSGDPVATVRNALLQRLGEGSANDPLRSALGRILASSEPEPREGRGANLGASGAHVQVRPLLLAAREALNELQKRSDVLAAALGACAECWGAHQNCSHCGGIGRPGWKLPDAAAFAAWIEPAINAIKGDPRSTAADAKQSSRDLGLSARLVDEKQLTGES